MAGTIKTFPSFFISKGIWFQDTRLTRNVHMYMSKIDNFLQIQLDLTASGCNLLSMA